MKTVCFFLSQAIGFYVKSNQRAPKYTSLPTTTTLEGARRPSSASSPAIRPVKASNRLSIAPTTATNRQSENKTAASTTGHHVAKERPLYHARPPLGLVSPRRLSGTGAADDGPSPSRRVSQEPSEKENGTSSATNALTGESRSIGGGSAARRGRARDFFLKKNTIIINSKEQAIYNQDS